MQGEKKVMAKHIKRNHTTPVKFFTSISHTHTERENRYASGQKKTHLKYRFRLSASQANQKEIVGQFQSITKHQFISV